MGGGQRRTLATVRRNTYFLRSFYYSSPGPPAVGLARKYLISFYSATLESILKELIEKITSYNLFTNLFPGVIFCLFSGKISSIDLLQKDIIVGVFVYYFIGLIISRVGSIIVEPILRKTRIALFCDYKDFIKASKNDPKLETLSETNNTFRNLISTILCLSILALFSILIKKLPIIENYKYIVLALFMLLILVFSYRKQTKYICKRVDVNKEV